MGGPTVVSFGLAVEQLANLLVSPALLLQPHETAIIMERQFEFTQGFAGLRWSFWAIQTDLKQRSQGSFMALVCSHKLILI